MKYKGTYFEMWDTWYLNVNDTVHAFHLKNHPGDDWNVGHIYTDDLLHFKKMRDVLETLPEEKYPDDCIGKYTGCAVEKDGTYYLYYTMRDKVCSEKIGLALSKDLEHFTEYEQNPVFELNKELFVVNKKGEKTNCRDMLIVYDEETEKYFGYFAAMANINDRGELGVIGVTESTDLLHWTNQRIVYIPEFNGVVEVPNVFKLNNKWYMTLMTSVLYGAKGAVSEAKLNSYIIVASSNTPNGMFKCSDDNVFLGSSRINNGYALRCVEFKGKLYAMCIDRSEYGASISLPKEVREINGIVKPCYADILKTMRKGKVWDSFEFCRIPTSVGWKNVTAGELVNTENGLELTAYHKSLQAFKANIDSVKSIEAEFEISGDFEEAGLVLYCSDNKIPHIYEYKEMWEDYVWQANYISLNKRENLIVFDKGMSDCICQRQFNFNENEKVHVRVIAMEGQVEVYLNDVLYISCAMQTKSCIAPGLFAFSGKAEISDFKVYELEE